MCNIEKHVFNDSEVFNVFTLYHYPVTNNRNSYQNILVLLTKEQILHVCQSYTKNNITFLITKRKIVI